MSPRFGLALLLLCFVLLGLSDAQRQQQQRIQQRQGQYTQNRNVASGNSARRGPGRASGRSTGAASAAETNCGVDTTDSPKDDDVHGPEIPEGFDSSKNQLASNIHDRFKKRP